MLGKDWRKRNVRPFVCLSVPSDMYSNWLTRGSMVPDISLYMYSLRKTEARVWIRPVSSHQLLVPPTFRLTTVGRRTFPVAASLLCNSLPSDSQSSPSLPVFRQRLKTFLFRQSFPNIVLWLLLRVRELRNSSAIFQVETDRNSVLVTVFRPKPPKNMVSAWFRLRQKGTVELRFRPKLDHVETETGRNWISSVSCSDLQSDDVIFQKLHWAGPRPSP